MLPANGLYGHIRNNNFRSIALLAGFLVLLELLSLNMIAFKLGMGLGLSESWGEEITAARAASQYMRAFDMLVAELPTTIVIVMIWFALAYVRYAQAIRAEIQAAPLERRDAKRLYNIVEKLAITAGLPLPRIELMDTDALNACASGLSPREAVISVTRGLVSTLSDDELEAVIAHEITHIKNYDIRVMLAASISVGILTNITKRLFKPVYALVVVVMMSSMIMAKSYAGLFIVAFVIAAAAFIFKFAISRAREFMADAGAVELTKNPGALVSALRKISANDYIEASLTTQAMMISNSLQGWFSTHPSLDERLAALAKFAGARGLSVDSRAQVLSGTLASAGRSMIGQPTRGRATFGLRKAL